MEGDDLMKCGSKIHIYSWIYKHTMFKVNPLSANPAKWSNCLGVFDHFVGLALTVLTIKTLQRINYPINIYLFKVNIRNTRKRCKICSKLTINPANIYLFKVNNGNIFHTFFPTVSLVEFEQVTLSWEDTRMTSMTFQCLKC